MADHQQRDRAGYDHDGIQDDPLRYAGSSIDGLKPSLDADELLGNRPSLRRAAQQELGAPSLELIATIAHRRRLMS